MRSELIRLQKQKGLSLISVLDNKIYTFSFERRSLNQVRPFSAKGTAAYGDFSEDGAQIAVTLCREPGITHPTPNETDCPAGFVLALMQADGSDPHEYADLANPGLGVCWSHDATKLVLAAQDRRKGRYAPDELQIFDLATGATQVIADGSESLVDSQCWSPDDKQVVYTANNLAGSEMVAVYDTDNKTSRNFSKGSRATWSPDGNWIALMECPPSLWGCKYYAVRPYGSERKLLFKSEAATPLWWSPDSHFVAYINVARSFERTAPQQSREMDRLRVRPLEDGSEDSFADFFDDFALVDLQWVENSQFKIPAAPSSPMH